MWRYGVTVIANLALRCKSCKNPGQDSLVPHSAITGIADVALNYNTISADATFTKYIPLKVY
jgi:hypothetical protein